MINELEKKLTEQVNKDPQVKILSISRWCFPVQTVECIFHPVKRETMDILMKMILLSVQKAEIKNPKELSDLLLVEELFVLDLLQKLMRKGLVEKEVYYQLTVKGERQLENGIYEEEMEEETQQLLYSATHHLLLSGDMDKVDRIDELPEPFKYASEETIDLDEMEIIDALQKTREMQEEEDQDEEKVQTFITSINSKKTIQIHDVPCIQYVLYNRDSDLLYVRVWNTLTDQWDENLENMLAAKDLLDFRREYLVKE